MSTHQLAQLNIAAMKAPLDDPLMAEFVANLDRINTLAEAAPGFVWRLQDEGGDATQVRPFGDNILVNMSVWADVASLRDFAFRSAHVEVMRKRRDWFERMAEAYAVLWWVPAGHIPTLEEAAQRLHLLRTQGPSPRAFTFKEAHAAPAPDKTAEVARFDDECPAL